jgi:quinol monooxygenase YgiN
MIVVAGTVPVHPERREDAVRVALTMAQATRAERGCIDYRFYADLADPNTFLIFEEWESDDALAKHFETEHMRVFREALPGLVGGAPSIHRYVVGEKAKLM